MDIFDVFSTEELEALSDDPRVAFAEIVRKARFALEGRAKNAPSSTDEREYWDYINEERHGFLNLVVAAGKRLKIEPFINYVVPKAEPFGTTDWREFKSELDHYMTQVALDNAMRGRREGISIPQDAKDRIRKHIHDLKKLIDMAEIDPKKKASMRNRLEQFEHELDKRRLPLGAVGLIALSLFALPPDLQANGDMAIKLISSIFGEVNDAKAIEDESRQLPLTSEPAMLLPPRAPEPKESGFGSPQRRRPSAAPAFESSENDDDIPF